MPTKYKYGKDGSFFDPETKRTYYKDPQYQKAYDDEWNRLEKLYEMRQEEQRRIERENFQRVLAQADALTKSMQALGYRTPLPWEQKNRFDGYEDSKIEKGYKKDSVTVTPVDQLAEYLSGVVMSGIQSTGDAITLYDENLTSAISDGIDNIRKAAEKGKKIFDNEITPQDRRLLQAGTPQRTYLLPRNMQEKAFLQDGYIIGKEGDYGPLGPEVRKHAKPIPVYQTAPDAIDPSKLYAIPGYYETNDLQSAFPSNAQMTEPASFPIQYFIDKSTGDLYQKGWDLNDYGVDSGGISSLYDPTYLKLTKLLDKFGSPTVITTGFQPVMKNNKPSNILDIRSNGQIDKQFTDEDTWDSFLDNLSKIVTKNPQNPDEPLEAVMPVQEVTVFGYR